MKKLSILSALSLVALLVASCGLQEPASGPQPDGESTTISAALATVQSKTWLDYASLKVYWSDGDRINVNGQMSFPIAVPEGKRDNEAEFLLPKQDPPYRVVYPAEVVTEYTSDGTVTVELPQTQAYNPTSFASGAALMCAYAESLEAVTLQNLCAAIRVNINGTEGAIESAELISLSGNAPLCGTFSLSPEEGKLTPVNGKNELSLHMETPVSVSEAGTDFFFVIPPGDYSEGLVFNFVNTDKVYMQNIWKPEESLLAGELYSFNGTPYEAKFKAIETAEDWNEFAADMNAEKGDASRFVFKDGVVRLGADINDDEVELKSITEEFKYIFDGNGKTIKRNKATSSLFSDLTGEIRDLTLDGKLSLKVDGAPFVTNLYVGAKITGCTNNMVITFDRKFHCYVTGIAAIAVRNDTEGFEVMEISNCTNNGKIEGIVDVSSANYNVAVAGIIGDVRASVGDVPYSLEMTGCKNTAPITLSPKSGDTATYGMTTCGVGGIIGYVRSAKSITLDNCDNSGDITVKADYIVSETGLKASPTAVGGIIGNGTGLTSSKALGSYLPLTGIDYTLTGCDNSGTIYNCMVNASEGAHSSNKVYTGGLAGSLVGTSDKFAKITSCTNTGDIYTYDLFGPSSASTPGTSAVGAGFIGFGGHLDMSGCTIKCAIGNGKRPVVSWSGVIGFAMRPFKLTDSDVYVTGYFQRLITYKLNRAMIAVIPTYYITKPADKEISNEMNIAPVLTEIVVKNCRIGGLLYTSGTTLSTDNKSEITGLTTPLFSSETSAKNNIVAGSGYSANKNCNLTFDMSTILYWTGN